MEAIKLPDNSIALLPSMAMQITDFGMKLGDNFKNIKYCTYFPKSGNVWEVRQNTSPRLIKNIKGNHKNLKTVL